MSVRLSAVSILDTLKGLFQGESCSCSNSMRAHVLAPSLLYWDPYGDDDEDEVRDPQMV
jgi:hypothetical protein